MLSAAESKVELHCVCHHSSLIPPLNHTTVAFDSNVISLTPLGSELTRKELRLMEGDAGHGGELIWNAHTIKIHAVQCAKCGKFRSIPFKRTYEKIRAKILERPWVCEDAFAWTSSAGCEIPDEFVGKSKLVFTVDRPGVPVTPAGWDRTVHIRAGPGNEHFADIFYFAPGNGNRSLRRLRSMKGIERFIEEFPEARPPVADTRRVFSFARPTPPPGLVKKSQRD